MKIHVNICGTTHNVRLIDAGLPSLGVKLAILITTSWMYHHFIVKREESPHKNPPALMGFIATQFELQWKLT